MNNFTKSIMSLSTNESYMPVITEPSKNDFQEFDTLEDAVKSVKKQAARSYARCHQLLQTLFTSQVTASTPQKVVEYPIYNIPSKNCTPESRNNMSPSNSDKNSFIELRSTNESPESLTELCPYCKQNLHSPSKKNSENIEIVTIQKQSRFLKIIGICISAFIILGLILICVFSIAKNEGYLKFDENSNNFIDGLTPEISKNDCYYYYYSGASQYLNYPLERKNLKHNSSNLNQMKSEKWHIIINYHNNM